jgi:hypothetical protein
MLLLKPVSDDRVDPRLLGAALAFWGLWVCVKLAFVMLATPLASEAIWALNSASLRKFYADGPPGLALIARAGLALMPGSTMGLRLPVFAVASVLPLAIVWLAQPLVGRRQAIWAGVVSLILPPLAMAGLRFDAAPVIALLWVLALGFWVRAHAQGAAWQWVAGGLCVAGAVVCSPLALVPLIALFGLSLSTRAGRVVLSTPPVLLAFAVCLWGLLPYVLAALSHRLPPLVIPAWHFTQPLHGIGLGIAFASPIMVYGLVEAFKIAGLRTVAGDGRLAGLFTAGMATMAIIVLKALWGHVDAAGWTLCLALIAPLLPAAVEAFLARAKPGRDRTLRLGIAMAAPTLAVITIAALALNTLLWRAPDQMLPMGERWRVIGAQENWERLHTAVENAARGVEPRPSSAVVFTLGRDTGALLGWVSSPDRDVYTSATAADVAYGRAYKKSLWGQDEDTLMAEAAGRPVVLVLPHRPDLYTDPAAQADRARLCQRIDVIQPVKWVGIAPGRTMVELYTGVVRAEAGPLQVGCPLYPALMITTPVPGSAVGRDIQVEGIAAALSGVVQLEVLLDGTSATTAHYGFALKGLTIPPVLSFDPNVPDIGFAATLENVKPGLHQISLRATRRDGAVEISPAQTVYVK